jgi:hypothetical protein
MKNRILSSRAISTAVAFAALAIVALAGAAPFQSI